MIVGKVIEGYRYSNRISVRELAKHIGVDYGALWRFEQGRSVRSSAWTKIILWLLTGDEFDLYKERKHAKKPARNPRN